MPGRPGPFYNSNSVIVRRKTADRGTEDTTSGEAGKDRRNHRSMGVN